MLTPSTDCGEIFRGVGFGGAIGSGEESPPDTASREVSGNFDIGLAISEADVLSEVLAEDSRETRIGLSAATRKAAETLAKVPGAKFLSTRRHIST